MKANKRKLQELIRILKGRKVTNVCVEAGHIYVNESPIPEHVRGLEIGADICGGLAFNGIRSSKMVLVDDYNPSENVFCLRRYNELARGCGFEPDKVVMESSMVAGAQLVISELDSRKLVARRNDFITTARYNVRLCAARKMSCCVLDAAFYLQKLETHDFCVTVLPGGSPLHSYKSQQRHVRQILRLLGYAQLPLAVVYFWQDGTIDFAIPR